MNRRDRITILLEHYVDVLEGVRDRGAGDDDGILALMCAAWNHPSYRELERLRVRLRTEERALYWHLSETYFRAPKVRIAVCPRCSSIREARLIGELCNHGRKHSKTTERVAQVVRIIRPDVHPALVELAIDWIDSNWRRGDASIPDDLRPDRKHAA